MANEQIKFRKEALEHVSQPAKLNEALQIISAKAWILMAITFLIVMTFIGWLFLGNIELRVEGRGILLSTTNSVVSVFTPPQGGIVDTIHVSVGQYVQSHTLLVTIDNSLLTKKINEKSKYLNILHEEKQQLSQRETEFIAQHKKLSEEKVAKLQESLSEANSKLEQVKKLMELKTEAYRKNIETLDGLTKTRVDYYSLLQEIRSHEAEFIQSKANIADVKDTWKERQRQLDNTISSATEELAELKDSWQDSRNIYSPVSGTISEIPIKRHDLVTNGIALMNIVPGNQELYALAFVPADKGKIIKVQMDAKISPTEYKTLEFGSIKGKVISVSDFPVTSHYVISILKNPELAALYLKDGPVFAVKIQLERDNRTTSGYKWTTSKGPNSQLSQGTMVSIGIATKRIRPFSLFIGVAKNSL